jgi:hypothetical protein
MVDHFDYPAVCRALIWPRQCAGPSKYVITNCFGCSNLPGRFDRVVAPVGSGGIPIAPNHAGGTGSPGPLLSWHPPRFMTIPLHHTLTHTQEMEILIKDFQEHNRRKEALLNLPSLQGTLLTINGENETKIRH